jgi:hypothetical protein
VLPITIKLFLGLASYASLKGTNMTIKIILITMAMIRKAKNSSQKELKVVLTCKGNIILFRNISTINAISPNNDSTTCVNK